MAAFKLIPASFTIDLTPKGMGIVGCSTGYTLDRRNY
jgi:hypothetical protein